MAALVLVWGVLAGCIGLVNQYWIYQSAPEAPDFANGLFLAATNLGTSAGTSICGAVIAGAGTGMAVLGGFAILAACIVLLILRARQIKGKT